MARLAPQYNTLKALFARSGNQCAFPGCTHALFNLKNDFIGQLCHIEAALPGGRRYNETQTDEGRRAYSNLLLLCYAHHIEIDRNSEFTVERLQNIKQRHEAIHKADFQIEEAEILKVAKEMEEYWERIERLNRLEHSMPELAFEIDVKKDFFDILTNIRNSLDFIEKLTQSLWESDEDLLKEFHSMLARKNISPSIFSDVRYYENPFVNRNWEIHNLGIPNWLTNIQIDLIHLEVKYLEEYALSHIQDITVTEKLERAKARLAELAQHSTRVD